MGIFILEGKKINDNDQTAAVLYCNTSGIVISSVLFKDGEEAQDFLEWLDRNGGGDPRSMAPGYLYDRIKAFRVDDMYEEKERRGRQEWLDGER